MTPALITALTTSIVTILGAFTAMIVQIRSHSNTVARMTDALQNSQPVNDQAETTTKPPFTGA